VVNGASRVFGGTLGVAVIGSVAASLYTSRLAALLPPGLPTPAVTAARGSVGGAAIAAQQLSHAGLAGPAQALHDASVAAFLHGLTGACLVAAGVAAAGVLLVALWLPARPRVLETDAVGVFEAQPPSGIQSQLAGDQPGVGYAEVRAATPRATADGTGAAGAHRPLSS